MNISLREPSLESLAGKCFKFDENKKLFEQTKY